MTDEQEKQIVDSLVAFITRVANSETASDIEIEALPATVNSLTGFITDVLLV